MIKVSDIYSFIDLFAPFDTQADFDNSGYMTGDKNAEVKKALVSLDMTSDVLEQARKEKADLIITHHPLIFNPLRNVMNDSLAYKVITSGISVISAHTNLDLADCGVNSTLIKTLGIEKFSNCETDPFLKIAEIEPVSSDELVKTVSEKLTATVQFNSVKKTVEKIGFCAGAGSSCLYSAIDEGVDAFITGEAKYNMFLDADESDILLIAAGHFNTEIIIVSVLAEKLRNQFPDIEVIEFDGKKPVNYFSN